MSFLVWLWGCMSVGWGAGGGVQRSGSSGSASCCVWSGGHSPAGGTEAKTQGCLQGKLLLLLLQMLEMTKKPLEMKPEKKASSSGEIQSPSQRAA